MKAFREILSEWKGDRPLAAVAPQLGVALSTVHYWLNGDRLPPRTRLPLISQAMGMPLDELAQVVAASRPVEAA